MKLSRKEASFLQQAINQWMEDSIISPEQGQELKDSIQTKKFDWQSLSLYAFFFAILSLVVAVVAILADKFIIQLLEDILYAADLYKCIFFSILAIAFYFWAHRRSRSLPQQRYSNEALFFLGILSTAAALTFLGLHLQAGSGHFSLLILLSTVIYGIMAALFHSTLTWIFAILSLGAWFGTETGILSDWDNYFLGMNYPLRFLFFGAGLTGLAFLIKNISVLSAFYQTTLLFGLIHFFLSLYLLSIFGNYGELELWYDVKQTELIYWGIIMGVIAILAILIGLKTDYPYFREFGVIFLFLDLYTRYFELFWDNLHKAAFFSILAISFWIIGKKAEKIWTMDF